MESLVVLPHLHVQNANAIAGITWGFPAVTQFLGFTHALQRRLRQSLKEAFPSDAAWLTSVDEIVFQGCAIICHHTQHHAYQPTPYSDSFFSLTRNPLTKDGKTAAFNEEGRMHMEITLVIAAVGTENFDDEEEAIFTKVLTSVVPTMRLAGGIITGWQPPKILHNAQASFHNEKENKQFLRSLLPGFVLVSRQDILEKHTQKFGGDALEAWLDFSRLTYRATEKSPEVDVQEESTAEKKRDNQEKGDTQWELQQQYGGWIKPIAVGYRSMSPLYEPGSICNARDTATSTRFVESIYSLGQWMSPHRMMEVSHLFWQYDYDEGSHSYICSNAYQEPPVPDDIDQAVIEPVVD
ncbi:type I-F CRISPR-associated protein Csy2 [Marinibactrum halimedae]|uniref:Type I-F CRISPR-associated protein Csy2 n=1 Tax=Marinibactrum halimedae TaxID=1444977 RepID=A0AA37TF71_9GAMM|nr:type I-F CRISPR-associated protein Csy2 [Marinibactrum halimedae]MCD9460211.1 type I-F CRISPR-associated protein Csy2 [Marinibactrum halimedae]GLS27957.1 type I-F CRISPR-associated protein Csy2 [Marinibactrum halimedae]